MELIYRGIKYQSDKSKFHDFNQHQKLLLTWRKKTSQASTDKFPLAKYCQQFFRKQTPKVYSLTKFWHQHQRDCLETCWQIDVIENLNHCWRTTVIVELEQKFTVRTPIKLKYRGITYYR